MSASFVAQGVYSAFPTFLPLQDHYVDRNPRGTIGRSATAMGTVDLPRTGHGQDTDSSRASAHGRDRRASSESNNAMHQSAPSSQTPGQGRGSSHAPSQVDTTSPASTDPIQASMADNRYPSVPAQYAFPWPSDLAGPSGSSYANQSGPSYQRYHSSTPGADTADEYVVLAHHQLVSRPLEQSYNAVSMPVNWSAQSTQSFQQPSYSHPNTPFQTPSYQQFPFPMQFSSPPTMAPSPISTLASSAADPYSAGAMVSPYHPQGIPISRASVTSDTIASLSPDLTSPSSSMAGSVGSHRAGPIRKQRKSDATKEAANRPARGGPMSDVQKSKADMVRDLGACWRCRRYKKSCDGPGECSNCMRGNFRVWPSSLGCRRGCLEELVAHLVPVQAQDYLAPATRNALRMPNWRFGTVDAAQRQLISEQLPMADNWLRLSLKVQSTGMYGGEFGSLLDIVTKYQATQTRPNALLEASISLLDSTCDIYQNFVASAWPLPPGDINAAIVTAQRAYAGVSKMFLTSALSGRRRDWLPSFLSMCMAFCAVMIMMDAAIAVPPQTKAMVWGDVHNVSRDLRQRLYPVTTDLLRASSNGTKPFALGCWSVNEVSSADGSIELVRSPEGMRMLGQDKAAFDGMRSLQEWIRRNIRLMDMGTKVIRSDPFTTPEVPSIAAILKLFDL